MTTVRVLSVAADLDAAETVSAALEREDASLDVFAAPDIDALGDRSAVAECVVVSANRFESDAGFVERVRDVDSLVPVVVAAAEWNIRAAQEAVRAGAADYVTVGEGGDRSVAALARRIVSAAENYRDRRALDSPDHRVDTQRTRFQTLFEHASDAIAFTEYVNEVPIIRDINPAFEAVFGYGYDEVVGRNLNALVVPDEHRDQATRLDRETSEGDWVEREVRRRTIDGEFRDFLFRGIQVTTPTGRVEGYPIYTDITDRKERERELERQNERLDEFATFVSHDLRNPLNVAQGRLTLVADECDSPHLPEIADALDRMGSIVEDTLALARYSDPVDEWESIRIALLFEECWKLVDTGPTRLDVADEFALSGDPKRLRHLFENLFRNAVEHGSATGRPAAEGGAERDGLTVSVGLLADGSGFYVEDDGVGIPETERARVFEPGHTTGETGTGLGLTIVKRIADAHDWTVAVTEGARGGARFEFAGVSFAE